MCGIVGIVGIKPVSQRLLDGLSRLEYRGYDSAGLAVHCEYGLFHRKAEGKVRNLRAAFDASPIEGHVGIAHTRWATHGEPSKRNAHPHIVGNVSVVHNGIIENYANLKSYIEKTGSEFSSDTDTEVIAHLCQLHLEAGATPLVAVQRTIRALQGSYALCILIQGAGDRLFVARHGSPLLVGYGDAEPDGACEMFVGSDAVTLASFTDRVSYLEDGDVAEISCRRTQIWDDAGQEVVRPLHTVDVDQEDGLWIDEQHHMLREIRQQPAAIERLLNAYLEKGALDFDPKTFAVDFFQTDRVILTACGTAFYACQIARSWFEKLACMPVELEVASELRHRDLPLTGRDTAIFVSQSGETADTLGALRDLKGRVFTTLGVVNVQTSSLAREVDAAYPIFCGPEISVASTKAFTSQMMTLFLLALKCAKDRSALADDDITKALSQALQVPEQIQAAINLSPLLEQTSRDIALAQKVIFIGRGQSYPIASEAALKMKEVSYINAQAFAAGELKHGPIAIVDEHTPLVVFAPSGVGFQKTLSNAAEAAARGAKALIITDQTGEMVALGQFPNVIAFPDATEISTPFLQAIVSQFLAYQVAVQLGCDVDQPRNLAKCVTVE